MGIELLYQLTGPICTNMYLYPARQDRGIIGVCGDLCLSTCARCFAPNTPLIRSFRSQRVLLAVTSKV